MFTPRRAIEPRKAIYFYEKLFKILVLIKRKKHLIYYCAVKQNGFFCDFNLGYEIF